MTPENLVNALRTYPTKKLQSVALDAADLIERQAKALEETEKALREISCADTSSDIDGLHEGACACIADRAIDAIRAVRCVKTVTDDLAKYEEFIEAAKEPDLFSFYEVQCLKAITELVAMVREARAEIKSLRNPFALHLEAQEDFARIRAARSQGND